MTLRDLVLKTRSYRRFYQDQAVDIETLRALIDLARHSASGSNRQPLKYVLVWIIGQDVKNHALADSHLDRLEGDYGRRAVIRAIRGNPLSLLE